MVQQGITGLATSHGDILYALFKTERMTMAEIAARIGRDKSTVTVLVNKLTGLGYVVKERDSEDSRVTYVKLTAAGKSLEARFERVSSDVLNTFYRGISEEEKETLIQILSKIEQNF